MLQDKAPAHGSTLAELGQPVHGRSLEIEIFEHGPDRVKVKGVIVDLRKQGFVPTGGDLQASGIIHHMLLDRKCYHYHYLKQILQWFHYYEHN